MPSENHPYITDESDAYPYLLKQIFDPPQKLYHRGQLEILKKTCLAIVGTRKNSDYGEFVTKKIIQEISHLDVAVVSGLALGIDAIAHQAALDYGLSTIAVLGNGIDYIYPRSNIKLAQKIEKNSLILSEYSANEEAADWHFPARNRIISGLSIATIVIEAPEKSGALITASFALEQNREIFTVPGDIDHENSLGPLRLLQRGAAYPISSGKDLLEILNKQPHLFHLQGNQQQIAPKQFSTKDLPYNLAPLEKEILFSIPEHRPVQREKLLSKFSTSISQVLSAISLLEIKGLIFLKDGKYQRAC